MEISVPMPKIRSDSELVKGAGPAIAVSCFERLVLHLTFSTVFCKVYRLGFYSFICREPACNRLSGSGWADFHVIRFLGLARIASMESE
ncbi:hypothetical protein ES703_109523 [subsurface metagenome]